MHKIVIKIYANDRDIVGKRQSNVLLENLTRFILDCRDNEERFFRFGYNFELSKLPDAKNRHEAPLFKKKDSIFYYETPLGNTYFAPAGQGYSTYT